jgi:uncharacterized protein YPO0396
MRTAPNRRLVKADAPHRYRWVGRDNSALRGELEDELNACQRLYDDVTRRAELALGHMQAQQIRIDELDRLQADLSWADLDLEPVTRRLTALARDLDIADNPEQRALRATYKAAQQEFFAAKGAAAQAQQDVDRLNQLWGAVQRVQDAANDIVDAQEPLTADELAAAVALPFKAPALEKVDLTGRDDDEKTDAALQASYLDAAGCLEEQIRERDKARKGHERHLLAIIQAYRNIDGHTHRQVDDSIESLTALQHIHQQLVTDDLPRARRDWIKKIDADLNQGLRTLLQQIDMDRREITRGLVPINTVLAGVPFRHGSTWRSSPPTAQQPAGVPEGGAGLHRDNPLGEGPVRDQAKIEALSGSCART